MFRPTVQHLESADDLDKARSALNEMLEAGPKAWVEFDREVRGWTRHRFGNTALTRAGEPLPDTPLALALAMCSGDGYRRAEALVHPGLVGHRLIHPLVLIRAVDPVAPLRELAVGLLPSLIDPADRRRFSAMLAVAHRLRNRAHAEPMLAIVLDAITDAADETRLGVLADLDGRSAQWLGRKLIGRGALSAEPLTAIALGQFSDRLQEQCAETLAGQALSHEQPGLLQPLLAARSSRVLATALEALIRLGEPEHLEDLLGHRSAAVRATAQWGMRRAGDDPAVHYQAQIKASPVSPRWLIAGLGECGDAGDADLITPFLHDARPKTRATAVNALRNLAADTDLSRLLLDPSPGTVRATVAYAFERRALPPVRDLRDLVASRRPVHVRSAAGALLRHHGVWHHLWADLALLDDPDPQLSDGAMSDLDNLCRIRLVSVAAPIDDRLRAELLDLVHAAAGQLPANHLGTLRWVLKTARAQSNRHPSSP